MATSLPDWAKESVDILRTMEVYLGNLPGDKDWQSERLEKVQRRSFREEEAFDDHKVEYLFKKICQGLDKEGFEAYEISDLINAHLGNPKPAYCNAREVADTFLAQPLQV